MSITRRDYRINLTEGDSFIFRGYYCVVIWMKKYHFKYLIQETGNYGYMNYRYYMTTPSFIARQRKF